MVQMTKSGIEGVNRIASFYDALAADYDTMTGFQKRFIQEKPFFHLLVERFKIRTALDAGSGTGFHSLLLAQLGVRVISVDVSPEMLQHVEAHAHELSLEIEVVESSFQSLHKRIRTTFDAVFCLGNGLAHILSDDDLSLALKNFASVLKPNGVLILQNLNYDKILHDRERVQSVKESEGKTFVRFYDYSEAGITFNILTLARANGAVVPSLQTVPLKPWKHDELQSALERAGFGEIRTYGGITLAEFDQATSKDLVIVAHKSDAHE